MPLAAIHRLTWPQDINGEGEGAGHGEEREEVEEKANGQWGEVLAKLNNCAVVASPLDDSTELCVRNF